MQRRCSVWAKNKVPDMADAQADENHEALVRTSERHVHSSISPRAPTYHPLLP
jgi:hypothetical protein